ncbi:arylformamidase [Anaerobacillus alkaliphilus]|uniref:Kynurenine formamidase n=1 Tax=Anaerobacillus alkaliphilus TaxID=1548597 RepID=A0A4V1LFU5_9BACI|nr:arylformamidase [Anaerobacillus alkaliphilus]RXI96509.1 arylformamidase [Anaerobacillus alkaliphilus]
MKNQNKNPWIDISQPLTNELAHWPGDTPFSYEVTYTKEQTGSVNIGQITTSVHSGTHVDAPFHFMNDGKRILDLDINLYIGPCRMIDVSTASTLDATTLQKFDLDGVSRVLIRTSIPNNPVVFPKEIPYVTKCGAVYLAEKGVKLIGVDVPSVDKLDSKDLEGHHALYENGIHILENVMLDHIEPGDYELIALPLPLKEADGSPVRAVVRKL